MSVEASASLNNPKTYLPDQPVNPRASSSFVSLVARLAHEIPKPKDWQAFQRGCVILFREELGDPNTQEYGRGGQNQRGIDVLGRRGGQYEWHVGIQCRLVVKPLSQKTILEDCRAALKLKAELKELIFATSAPDDTGATDAALAVEQILRAEGHQLSITVYGWRALQTLIALREPAYNAFFPAAVSTSAPQSTQEPTSLSSESVSQIAGQIRESIQQMLPAASPPDVGGVETAQEDLALHARIDTLRDLFRAQNEPIPAESALLGLLEKEALERKPWARFRILTNLGSIALDLGREPEAVGRFEAAYAVLPDNAHGIANLALACLIQGRYDEAWDLAEKALAANPRSEYAISYLLQIAARLDWKGDPETLIPADLVGTLHADLGLAEFLRLQGVPDWARRTLALAQRHPEVVWFKRVAALAVLSLAIENGSLDSTGSGALSPEEIDRAASDMKAAAEHCLRIGFSNQHDLVCYLTNAGVLLRLAGRDVECEALLQSGLTKSPNDPNLRRLLALAKASQGRRDEALVTLSGMEDAENRLLAAELISDKSPNQALEQALAVDPAKFDKRLATLRFGLIGELALELSEESKFREAVAGLRALPQGEVTAELLSARWDRRAGLDDTIIHRRLKQIAASPPANIAIKSGQNIS